jgi:hypothetical protein
MEHHRFSLHPYAGVLFQISLIRFKSSATKIQDSSSRAKVKLKALSVNFQPIEFTTINVCMYPKELGSEYLTTRRRNIKVAKLQ